MLYFVSTDYFGDTPISPEQNANLHENLFVSLDILAKLHEEKKILAGGFPNGEKKLVFVVEASSKDEVTELIESLPFWQVHSWEIAYLENWEDQRQRVLKKIGKQG